MPNWFEVIAYLINTVLVVIIVQWLKTFWPTFIGTYPWVQTIAAPVVGAVLPILATAISSFLGYPVDFSAIVGVITGTFAIGLYDLGHGISKGRKK